MSVHIYDVRSRRDHRGIDLISDALPGRFSDVASLMRSQRSALGHAAQGKRIEEGDCGKRADQSDNDDDLSKTEHSAREHSKSGTHCYLRQGTESQSCKQIGPNRFFNPLIPVTMRTAT
jgi:hypothetical protein